MKKIIDKTGRIGIVTQEFDRGCIVKPEGIEFMKTATYWMKRPDGKLQGFWYDSPPGFVAARYMD